MHKPSNSQHIGRRTERISDPFMCECQSFTVMKQLKQNTHTKDSNFRRFEPMRWHHQKERKNYQYYVECTSGLSMLRKIYGAFQLYNSLSCSVRKVKSLVALSASMINEVLGLSIDGHTHTKSIFMV